jgi:hypothetical protein
MPQTWMRILPQHLRERLKEYERGKSSMFGLGKYLHRRNIVLDALCFLVSYVRDNPDNGGNIELILRKHNS